MILGDLNAGCSYVTIKGWRAVRLRSDPKFHWLIGDEQDTTVREKTHCAYDRSAKTAERCNTFICINGILSIMIQDYGKGFPLQGDVLHDLWFHRIIVHGREVISSVVPGSAQPFNFKKHFHLTEEEVTYTRVTVFTSVVLTQWTLTESDGTFRLWRWVIIFL